MQNMQHIQTFLLILLFSHLLLLFLSLSKCTYATIFASQRYLMLIHVEFNEIHFVLQIKIANRS